MRTAILLAYIMVSITASATPLPTSINYVWARSGLNLRAAPSTSSKVLAKIPFGDSLTVLRTSDIKYNITAIAKVDSTQYYYSRYERKAPYILYGHWVQVQSSQGVVGYVVDQYLLSLRPAVGSDYSLTKIATDTVSIVEEDYTSRYLVTTYQDGVTASMYINEKYYDETFRFPNMTIQQAFVLFTAQFESLENLRVEKNWKEKLAFNDSEICNITIQLIGGVVNLSYTCSC